MTYFKIIFHYLPEGVEKTRKYVRDTVRRPTGGESSPGSPEYEAGVLMIQL